MEPAFPAASDTGCTLLEERTAHFYAWEKQGRGWHVWSRPVDLEPSFTPFSHLDAPPPVSRDDGLHPFDPITALGRVSYGIGGLLGFIAFDSLDLRFLLFALPFVAWPLIYSRYKVAETRETTDQEEEADLSEEPPEVGQEPEDLVSFEVILPPETKISEEASLQLLLTLRYLRRPVAFELIGAEESVTLQFTCHRTDADHLLTQLHAHFPEAQCVEQADVIGEVLNLLLQGDTPAGAVIDFGLSKEFMVPVAIADFKADPLTPFVGALSRLQGPDTGIVQILFKPTAHDWGASISRAVTDGAGDPFFIDAPDLTKTAAEKLRAPLFAVAIRACGLASTRERALQIVKRLAGSFEQFSEPSGNAFLPLSNDGYPQGDHVSDVLLRQSRRSGMLLNAHELLSLVHLPSASVRAPALKRRTDRTKAVPAIATGHPLIIGENVHEGVRRAVSLSARERMKHTYVIGASGTGKSTLLLNMIVQDIAQGRGIGVLDPHGDLIDHILPHIPASRVKDVVLFDPQDTEYPIGFNILSAHSLLERELLASDLVSIFRRYSTSWGDQMNAVFANAILAFLENPIGGTLRDIRSFLLDKGYRERYLKTVADPELVFYWQREFPLLVGRAHVPILTRLDTFLRQKTIRHIVAQQDNRLDFRALTDGGKILLCKLSQGGIGSENAYLLGALLVAKFHQTAMSRQDVPESDRRDFFLYLDEFHHFLTPSLEALLSGTRKYHLGLILAHQDLRQMMAKDRDVAAAVLTNAATRICFRVSEEDARTLTEGFSFFTQQDLQNLETGQAICRVERADYDFNLATIAPPIVDPAAGCARKAAVVAHTRAHYAIPREQVEKTLSETLPLAHKEATAIPPRPSRVAPPAQSRATVPAESNGYREGSSPTPLEGSSESSVAKKTNDSSPKNGRVKQQEKPGETLSGKGGSEHRYLQHLIRRLGEDRGFAVTLEKPILDGFGNVDVALERENMKIACEISVTSTAEYEAGNITKCVSAGYDPVIVVCAQKRPLQKLETRLQVLLADETLAKVRFLVPDEVITYLNELPVPEESIRTVGGYKVRVKYTALDPQEKAARKQAIANVLARAIKRFKQKSS